MASYFIYGFIFLVTFFLFCYQIICIYFSCLYFWTGYFVSFDKNLIHLHLIDTNAIFFHIILPSDLCTSVIASFWVRLFPLLRHSFSLSLSFPFHPFPSPLLSSSPFLLSFLLPQNKILIPFVLILFFFSVS
jgi:hypothetical protein